MPTFPDRKRLPLVTTLIETFGFSPAVASVVAVIIAGASVLALIWVLQSAPPRTLRLASGPEGTSFHRWALEYQKALSAYGVQVEVLLTGGAQDNIQQLQASSAPADIAFLPGGIADADQLDGLMSLGSVAHQPLWVFYRGAEPIVRLSQLAGGRIAVGAPGSGTRSLALTLLRANGITGEPTVFSDREAGGAAAALLRGELDAVFLMGDSASLQTLRHLVRSSSVRVFSFQQADAYVRRHAFLNRIELPQGAMDLGQNLPDQDLILVGPTVELVAREGLHAALSDVLLEAAKSVHGRPGLLQRRGEFPAAVEHEIPLSPDALRYYKSGKGFMYRTIRSFWLASLLNRILVAVLPLLLVVLPAIKLLPVLFRLSIQLRLYRCYRPLLRLERETYQPLDAPRVRELLERLDEIEQTVNRLKIPASFADRFYWLRSHIVFVRQRLKTGAVASPATSVDASTAAGFVPTAAGQS